jgi:hypothetical protein
MTQARNSEVGATLAVLNLASWNDHVVIDPRKTLFLRRIEVRKVRFCMEIGDTYDASGEEGVCSPEAPPPPIPQSEN